MTTSSVCRMSQRIGQGQKAKRWMALIAASLVAIAASSAWADTQASQSLDPSTGIHIQMNHIIYTGSVLQPGFMSFTVHLGSVAQPQPESSLPDHGKELEAIRTAFLDGVHETSKPRVGATSCPKGEPRHPVMFSVTYRNGLMVSYQQEQGTIEIEHVDLDAMKSEVANVNADLVTKSAGTFDLDQVRRSGKALSIVFNEPCIRAADLGAIIGSDVAMLVNYKGMPSSLAASSHSAPLMAMLTIKNPAYPDRADQTTSVLWPKDDQGQLVSGRLMILALVDKDGHVKKISVQQSSGHPQLDEVVLAAVRRWQFAPQLNKGVPVEGNVSVPFAIQAPTSAPAPTATTAAPPAPGESHGVLPQDIHSQL